MGLEMVDRHQRLAQRRRQRLGRRQPHQHTANQAGSRSRGNGVDVTKLQTRLVAGPTDDPVEMGHVAARRQFRDNPAIGGVLFELAAHDTGKNPAAAVGVPNDNGRRGLIATGLDSQNFHVRLPGAEERSKPSPA